MAQPTFNDLFGPGATWDALSNKLTITFPTSNQSGTPVALSALEVYGTIVSNGHAWLNPNTDSTVMATSDLTVQAPLVRNGQPRTQFQFNQRFFGNYSAPSFDPSQI